MQNLINFYHLAPKSIIRIIKLRISLSQWSQVSSRSSLHKSGVLLAFFSNHTTAFAASAVSRICLPSTITFCKVDTISHKTFFNLLESTFNVILCGPYGEITRIAFQGVENAFVHLRGNRLSPISFWCAHEVPNNHRRSYIFVKFSLLTSY